MVPPVHLWHIMGRNILLIKQSANFFRTPSKSFSLLPAFWIYFHFKHKPLAFLSYIKQAVTSAFK